MTIQAELPHRSTDSPQSTDRNTDGLDAKNRFHPDARSVLDHRTRARCIVREDVPPGRYLEVGDGDQARLIPLAGAITHIGRGVGADLRLEDSHVSRRHAIVGQRGDGARVLDDRSRNGTFVNGRRVTIAYLNDGDVLRLGRVTFRFVEVAPAREPLPALRPIALPIRAALVALARTRAGVSVA
jgi:hypothetical protein